MASTYSANGTVSIQDTNYAIPAGAYFVSNAGSDSNSGTQASPWLTVGHAISAAPAGATIVLRAGTYREGGYTIGKQLTLQPYPHEQAWLKGSVIVTAWTATGSIWMHTGWATQFANTAGTPGAPYGQAPVNTNYPLAGYPDMVFVNGVALTCAANPTVTGGQSSVGPGKFYIDYTNQTIYIGNNPNGATVEVAQYQRMIYGISTNSIIRGLGFQHYASSYHGPYAIETGAVSNCTIENNTIAWCAASGMSVWGTSNCTIRGNTFAFNGEQGIATSAPSAFTPVGTTIQSNYFAYNNIRNFDPWWDAAGCKITSNNNVNVTNNLFDHNNCPGVWFDLECSNNNIVNNICIGNYGPGIFYEYDCHNAIIANNLSIGSINGAGVWVASATNVQVWNNTCSDNYYGGIFIQEEGGRTATTTGITVENNITSADVTSTLELIRQWSGLGHSAGAMITACDYNAYYRANAANPGTLAYWNSGSTNYTTLTAFKATGYEAHGIGTDGGANPYFVGVSDNTAQSYYVLKSGSPAIGAGAALPTVSKYLSPSIAAAIGISYAGGPVNMGILSSIGPNPGSNPPAAATTTSLTLNPNPSLVSGPVTFSSTVTASDSSIPTGTVGFYSSTAAATLDKLMIVDGGGLVTLIRLLLIVVVLVVFQHGPMERHLSLGILRRCILGLAVIACPLVNPLR